MILVINAGSSSLKYTLFDESLHVTHHGIFEEISSHAEAVATLEKEIDFSRISAIGHRVVHGGEHFHESVVIDDGVIEKIRSLIPLAPLHNPANLEAIEAFAPKNIVQVAVFDTAFHQSMPERAYRYALPNRLYERLHVRKYGFHGTSHEYVSKKAAQILDVENLNAITLHIGNGVSLCGIVDRKSVDTTMGMTPLEGAMMGTRCGSIDPAIALYLQREGYSVDAVDRLFNKESGLLGIAGESDMRRVLERDDEAAKLAVDIYVYRLKKELGALLAVVKKPHALIFTGGVGENATVIRQKVCRDLEHFGILIDERANESGETLFSAPESSVKLLCIPTDEELQIALHVKEITG